jgi:hypothetical protein
MDDTWRWRYDMQLAAGIVDMGYVYTEPLAFIIEGSCLIHILVLYNQSGCEHHML